jgi:hypothetical protein
MIWATSPCATWYNVYRLVASRMTDADNDGVADNYGECYQRHLEEPEMVDPTQPPTGMAYYYAVTAQNSVGEGTMGYASDGQERTNHYPCP